MPGYVEHKVFVAEDGERVTLVTFADRDVARRLGAAPGAP